MCVPLIAGVVAGIGSAMQMANNAANSKASANLERRQAEMETRAGAYRADRQQDEVDRALGSMRLGYASSGLALDGTPGDVLAESAQEGAMDVAAIRWNSQVSADNSLYKARVHDMNARSAKMATPLAFAAPVINSAANTDFARLGTAFGS